MDSCNYLHYRVSCAWSGSGKTTSASMSLAKTLTYLTFAGKQPQNDQTRPAATSSYQQLLAATSSYHLHMSHIASFRIALVMPLFLPCEAKLAPGIRVNVGQCPVQLWQRNSKCCYDNNNAIGNPELSLGMCLLWLSCTLCKVSERFCCFNMFQSVFVITCNGPRSKEGFSCPTCRDLPRETQTVAEP